MLDRLQAGKGKSMKKNKNEMNDWSRTEYQRSDFKKLVRGKYAHKVHTSTNVVMLDPQVAKVFSNDQSVNNALRTLIELARSSVRIVSHGVK